MNYPLFALRKSSSITEEDGFVIVQSYFNRYILDDKNIEANSFTERRVLMLGNKYQYPIYPLNKKCTTPVQVHACRKTFKTNKFIDSEGNILTYKPTNRVRVEWKQAKYYNSPIGEVYVAAIEGEPYTFMVKHRYRWLAVITYNGGRYILDTSDEEPRRKITWKLI